MNIQVLMAPLLSIFVLLVFVLHVASESTREVVEQIDGEELNEELLFRPLPDQKVLFHFHFESRVPPTNSYRHHHWLFSKAIYQLTLQQGYIFVFPKGLVHFQFNSDSKNPALALSTFGSSARAGTVSVLCSEIGAHFSACGRRGECGLLSPFLWWWYCLWHEGEFQQQLQLIKS
uniref:Germin-like protein n=1 Tax=Lactuca sativa TaxID=4236 RepID=A0A9R1VAD8_LACSA|nr:hypothetical protein LSAT_V11C600323250 [Lactuca sativa]